MITKNSYIISRNKVEIVLRNISGKETARAIIDFDNFEEVSKCNWYYHNGYGYNRKINKYIHNIIAPKVKGFEVDHISRNRLDNRKKNLRYVTRSQNMLNKNNVKGYAYMKVIKRWHAYVYICRKKYNLGYYKTEEEAKKARNTKGKKLIKKYFDSVISPTIK